MRFAKLRPLTGSVSISTGDTLTPSRADTGVDDGRGRFNGDLLRDAADSERHVERLDLPDRERDLADPLLKSLQFDDDRIGRRR